MYARPMGKSRNPVVRHPLGVSSPACAHQALRPAVPHRSTVSRALVHTAAWPGCAHLLFTVGRTMMCETAGLLPHPPIGPPYADRVIVALASPSAPAHTRSPRKGPRILRHRHAPHVSGNPRNLPGRLRLAGLPSRPHSLSSRPARFRSPPVTANTPAPDCNPPTLLRTVSGI